ncbi:4-hydroxy-tetrahydrodipicolinate reductase [Maritimibacter dapengensis]|uniref:4-hydroxy-tetrahydrodipicolinate reductase n=1 Tax=Maritimibacter dapengensis TaxID=2836868 RepID=A0ABS6T5D0_9RHOB|nr:4-hydroxy-tetrahydrodipicolinate reductase [Maritimibacter dapengensis]MBV7380423.1 4-hydroxy-tetrahydrodipicolinate reductase [Maritimibacter dapengensis]
MMKVCMAGATGLSGSVIAQGIVDAEDMELSACVSRSHAGQSILGAPCYSSVSDALSGADWDVLIDYTALSVVKENALTAIEAGRHVVIGTSGLKADDFEHIDAAARAKGVGVVASGNFALTAALMTRFSLIAAAYLDWFEIIDYSRPKKTDAPTGTARELAERMGDVKKPAHEVDPSSVKGEPGLRGGTINGVQVHSLRMPSYSATVTSTFANGNSRLTITHDADSHSADILVPGTLLAARRVVDLVGVTRGLDQLL